jgi:hypothetical protein
LAQNLRVYQYEDQPNAYNNDVWTF